MLRDKACYCLAGSVNFSSSADYSMCYFFSCNNTPPASLFVVRPAKTRSEKHGNDGIQR